MFRVGAIVALVLLCAAGAGAVARDRAEAQTAGQIVGSLPRGGGFALIVWGGGDLNALSSAASAQSCPLVSAWATTGGSMVGHILGAPAFVNAGFTAMHPSGQLPPGGALLLVCRSPAPPPAALQSVDAQLAAVVTAGINRVRADRGLPPLRTEGRLTVAAEKYIVLVRNAGQLSHTLDGEPWDRARREGYPTFNVGEVLAARTYFTLDVQRDGDAIVNQWLNSPPHRDIILGVQINFTELGVGCTRGTQGSQNWLYCVGVTGRP